MVVDWVVALKVIPWREVIKHTPTVLGAARKLLDKNKGGVPSAASAVEDASTPPGPAELHGKLIDLQRRIDEQAAVQEELAHTLTQLAEQAVHLVHEVHRLRLQTWLLAGATALMGVALAVLAWR